VHINEAEVGVVLLARVKMLPRQMRGVGAPACSLRSARGVPLTRASRGRDVR